MVTIGKQVLWGTNHFIIGFKVNYRKEKDIPSIEYMASNLCYNLTGSRDEHTESILVDRNNIHL